MKASLNRPWNNHRSPSMGTWSCSVAFAAALLLAACGTGPTDGTPPSARSITPASSATASAHAVTSPLSLIETGHGFVTASCNGNRSEWQLSLLAYSDLHQITEATFPPQWTAPEIGNVSLFGCDAQLIDVQRGWVAVISGAQPDGSVHTGWVNLATGKFTDVTAIAMPSGGFSSSPVQDLPLGFTTDGTFWFTRASSGQSTQLLSYDGSGAPHVVDQCATSGGCWGLGRGGPLPTTASVIGGVLYATYTADGSSMVVLGSPYCEPGWNLEFDFTVLVRPASVLPTDGAWPAPSSGCQQIQDAAGNTASCVSPVAVSGSFFLCDPEQGDPSVLEIGTPASTITLQALLPANTNSTSLFWADPASGAILFLSTPNGGTETTLYSCNVNHPGTQPTSLGAVAAATVTQLEQLSLVDAQ